MSDNKHEFKFPTQPELISLIRERLSDGKNHSVEEIREFCRLKLNIPDAQLEIVYESNRKPKFMILVSSAIDRMKKSGAIEQTMPATYRLATEQNRDITLKSAEASESHLNLDDLDRAFIKSLLNGRSKIGDIKDFCAKELSISRRKTKDKEIFEKNIKKSRIKLEGLKLIEKIPGTLGRYRLVASSVAPQALVSSEKPTEDRKSTSTASIEKSHVPKYSLLNENKIPYKFEKFPDRKIREVSQPKSFPVQSEICAKIRELMRDGKSHSKHEINEHCEIEFDLRNLNKEEKRMCDGRISAALDFLKSRGELSQPRRGIYQLANPK